MITNQQKYNQLKEYLIKKYKWKPSEELGKPEKTINDFNCEDDYWIYLDELEMNNSSDLIYNFEDLKKIFGLEFLSNKYIELIKNLDKLSENDKELDLIYDYELSNKVVLNDNELHNIVKELQKVLKMKTNKSAKNLYKLDFDAYIDYLNRTIISQCDYVIGFLCKKNQRDINQVVDTTDYSAMIKAEVLKLAVCWDSTKNTKFKNYILQNRQSWERTHNSKNHGVFTYSPWEYRNYVKLHYLIEENKRQENEPFNNWIARLVNQFEKEWGTQINEKTVKEIVLQDKSLDEIVENHSPQPDQLVDNELKITEKNELIANITKITSSQLSIIQQYLFECKWELNGRSMENYQTLENLNQEWFKKSYVNNRTKITKAINTIKEEHQNLYK